MYFVTLWIEIKKARVTCSNGMTQLGYILFKIKTRCDNGRFSELQWFLSWNENISIPPPPVPWIDPQFGIRCHEVGEFLHSPWNFSINTNYWGSLSNRNHEPRASTKIIFMYLQYWMMVNECGLYVFVTSYIIILLFMINYLKQKQTNKIVIIIQFF